MTTELIEVMGTVLDPKAIVEVNGIPAVVNGNTFTAAGIVLKDGLNNITATATNTTGKTTSDTVFITYSAPIMIYITFPYDGSNLSVTPIDVEGIVSAPAASVEVNGVEASVREDGRFIASGISLSEGLNQITTNATKSDGSTGSYGISVNYTASQVTPIAISINSPENNAMIDRPLTIVGSTFTTDAEEVSIKVNGVVAETYGNQFVANGVPLIEGNNTIIVNALDSNRAVGRAERNVSAVTTAPYITLSSNITSGIPPLTTYFSVSTEIPNPVAEYQIDFEGDGIIDYGGETLEDISHAYETEGVYYPTVTVTDDRGKTYTDILAIIVMNKAEIDTLLKEKWEEMKTALEKQDISTALTYFAEDSRQLYNDIFSSLNNELPQLTREMQEIQPVYIEDNTAKYRIGKNELYGGRMLTVTYYIYFVIDRNGIWKIIRF